MALPHSRHKPDWIEGTCLDYRVHTDRGVIYGDISPQPKIIRDEGINNLTIAEVAQIMSDLGKLMMMMVKD